MSHLGAKSVKEAAQKLAAEKKKERAEKYPMCEKLTSVRSDKAIIDSFLEWLEEKKIGLCEGAEHDGRRRPIRQSTDKLLMEYFGIDEAQLEKERRKILAAQRKANGDVEEEEDG